MALRDPSANHASGNLTATETPSIPLRTKSLPSTSSSASTHSQTSISNPALSDSETAEPEASMPSSHAKDIPLISSEQHRRSDPISIPISPPNKDLPFSSSSSQSPRRTPSFPASSNNSSRRTYTTPCPHCGMLRSVPLPFTERGTSPPRSHPSLLFPRHQSTSTSNSHSGSISGGSPIEQCCGQEVFYPDIAMPDDVIVEEVVVARHHTRRSSSLWIAEDVLPTKTTATTTGEEKL